MEFETMMQCFENPVKRRIVVRLFDDGPQTPKELIMGLGGMSQATVYRALSSMESEGVIDVVREEKKRAIMEKTYGISEAYMHLKDSIVRENNVKAYTAIMGWSMHRLYSSFERYSERTDVDIAHDGSGFMADGVYLNSQDLEDIRREFAKVVEKYKTRRSQDQSYHTLATVITPPEDDVND